MAFAPQGPPTYSLRSTPRGGAGVRGRPAGNGPPRCLTLRIPFDIAESRLKLILKFLDRKNNKPPRLPISCGKSSVQMIP
jgi:hypothetical protein